MIATVDSCSLVLHEVDFSRLVGSIIEPFPCSSPQLVAGLVAMPQNADRVTARALGENCTLEEIMPPACKF